MKLGQGNIFTSVCQEFCPRGEGVCLSACWDIPPHSRPTLPDQAVPPWTRQTSPRPGRHPTRPGRHPLDQADTPQTRQTPQTWQTSPRPGRHPPGPGRHPRTRQTPPQKLTPEYSLRAAGTHPTGMHSCSLIFLDFSLIIFTFAPIFVGGNRPLQFLSLCVNDALITSFQLEISQIFWLNFGTFNCNY